MFEQCVSADYMCICVTSDSIKTIVVNLNEFYQEN